MLNIEKQIRKLYASSVLGNLSLTGAWVAILAARGYNLVDIGIAETVFHITSLIFEIPSGVLADVFGRKKMLIVSSIMRMIGNIIMILSDNLFTVCLSIAFHALSYNFSSGTGDALAYDSLKAANAESRFERFESDQLVIYRLCSGISTLCAGFALFIGHIVLYLKLVERVGNELPVPVILTLQNLHDLTGTVLQLLGKHHDGIGLHHDLHEYGVIHAVFALGKGHHPAVSAVAGIGVDGGQHCHAGSGGLLRRVCLGAAHLAQLFAGQ